MAVPVVLLLGAAPSLPLELRWRAPPECPSQGDVVAQVAQMVRPQALLPPDRRVDASAAVRLTGGTWTLSLDTRTPEGVGHRELVAPTCQKIADALALILALAIDPEARMPREPSAPRGPLLAWAVRPEARGDIGTVPGVSAGLGIAVAATRRALRLEVEGGGWLPRTTHEGPRPGAGGRIQLLVSGGLRACYGLLPGAWEVAPCAGAEAGLLRGRGVGIADPEQGSALWAAGAGGLFVSHRFGSRLSVRAGAEVLIALRRPSFVIEGFGEVFRPAPVAARATIGLEVRLP